LHGTWPAAALLGGAVREYGVTPRVAYCGAAPKARLPLRLDGEAKLSYTTVISSTFRRLALSNNP
jgi:hypothetical protein